MSSYFNKIHTTNLGIRIQRVCHPLLEICTQILNVPANEHDYNCINMAITRHQAITPSRTEPYCSGKFKSNGTNSSSI